LALDQAGAYIEETACGLLSYLDLYQRHAPELLQRRGALAYDHPDPVASTWALSFENIEKANPAASELLHFCAFLYPDGIPEEMFIEGAAELGPVLESLGSDALAWNDAMSEILKYSLLRRDPNASTLEIHRLMQAVLKRGMAEATQRLWAERAVRAINRAFPDAEFSNWDRCDRFLPQAAACAEFISKWGFEFPEATRLLNETGFYLLKRGRYELAYPFHTRALAILKKTLGPEHPSVAESLFRQALAIDEKSFGPEHPAVARDLNNLALLLKDTNQHAEAEPLFQRALAIREKALGSEHPDVATSLENYARCLRAMDRSQEAEPLEARARAIRAKNG
jgi:tetratricopeptide (TPR) repeat protein